MADENLEQNPEPNQNLEAHRDEQPQQDQPPAGQAQQPQRRLHRGNGRIIIGELSGSDRMHMLEFLVDSMALVQNLGDDWRDFPRLGELMPERDPALRASPPRQDADPNDPAPGANPPRQDADPNNPAPGASPPRQDADPNEPAPAQDEEEEMNEDPPSSPSNRPDAGGPSREVSHPGPSRPIKGRRATEDGDEEGSEEPPKKKPKE